MSAAPEVVRGLLSVYTGAGKGKTTAALGLIPRALGHGLRVGVMQFIKGKWSTGERKHFEARDDVEFEVMGRGFTWDSDDLSRDKRSARLAWDKVAEWIHEARFEMIILDELTYVMNYGFVPNDEITTVLQDRPDGVHVVVTGRNAPPELVECADLVTEMSKLKHPFDNGLRAVRGLDY